MDCRDYDHIPTDKIEKHFKVYHPYCGALEDIATNLSCNTQKFGLDDPFILYNMVNFSWTVAHNEPLCVRKMWDPQIWNVVYELGPFWEKSGVQSWCEDKLDSPWLIQTSYDIPGQKYDHLVNTEVNQLSYTKIIYF